MHKLWTLSLILSIGHNSAFDAVYVGEENPSILLNGRGNVTRYKGVAAELDIPEPYTCTFEKQTSPRPKRYLLRIINTSFDTTFIFSIDNHNLTIIGSDFVPIHPYSNTSVLIGIGQRYHVVVEANPIANGSQSIPKDGNFWMRTYNSHCPKPGNLTTLPGYERTGILRYNSSSTAIPTSLPWTVGSEPNDVSLACSDETYSSLVPILEWQVGDPANGQTGEEHDVRFNPSPINKPFPLALFSLEMPGSSSFDPLRIDYSDPIFLHLNFTQSWPREWNVVPEDYTSTKWASQINS